MGRRYTTANNPGDTAPTKVSIPSPPSGTSSAVSGFYSEGIREYKLPLILPQTKQVTELPYKFKETHDWKMFSTNYFDIYYFSNENEVFRMSVEFDKIYDFLVDKFGIGSKFPGKIPVYFQTEKDFSEEASVDWSNAYWMPSEKSMFIQIKDKVSIDRLLTIFKHELIHAVTVSGNESRLRAPSWYNEAVATYYELKEPHSDFTRQNVAYRAFKDGKLIPLSSIPKRSADWSKEQASVIYAEAQSFYTFLTNTYGETKIDNLWFTRGEFSQVIAQATGKSLDELEKDWRAYLQDLYAKDAAYEGIQFYDNAYTYIGQMRHGVKIGQGKMFKDGKLQYEGDFKDGDYEGKGKLYQDGRLVYEGDFHKNKVNGQGTMYAKDGAKYVGGVNNGEISGFGKLYSKDGRLFYEGTVKNGDMDGQGTYYFTDGTKYIGQFVDGEITGTGKVYNRDGVLLFEGKFKNSKLID